MHLSTWLQWMLRRAGRRKIIHIIVVIAIFVFSVKYFRRKTLDWNFEAINIEDPEYRPREKHSQWIVVTTIQEPTPQLRALSRLDDWKMVIVGDRKTPKHWKIPGCVYLDVKAQKALNYRITHLLPYDSYKRKSVGYLYAIENGAKWIYETDDDNAADLSAFWLSVRPVDMLTPDIAPAVFNPYPHFGQSTMWPRGYPLDKLSTAQSRHYRVCRLYYADVQQGLANGDPDVDAVFRLSRKSAVPLRFDSAAPSVALPSGIVAPYNSQNTLHAAHAFWAMLLPVTVTDRVTDIYRAYWAQRLLWLVGGGIVFHPANAWHQRNNHSALLDAAQEESMVRDTGRLIQSLNAWRCRGTFLFDCVIELTRHLVEDGFLQHRDIDMTSAWLADLAGIGYAPPLMSAQPKACLTSIAAVRFYPSEQLTSFAHLAELSRIELDTVHRTTSARFLAKLCPQASSLPSRARNILLVVTVGSDAAKIIPIAQLAYGHHFIHVIYCGSTNVNEISTLLVDWRASYISMPSADAISCMTAALHINYNVSGVLHLSHRLAVPPDQLPLNFTQQTWFTDQTATKSLCQQRHVLCQRIGLNILTKLHAVTTNNRADVVQSCYDNIAAMLKSRSQSELLYHPDVPFYIPRRLAATFVELVDAYAKHKRTAPYAFYALMMLECIENYSAKSMTLQFAVTLADVHVNSTVRYRFCEQLHR